MRLFKKALGAAAVLTVLATAPDAQTQVSIKEARFLAFKLVAAGKYDEAAALSRTILQGDPDDQAALLALAQAEVGAGRISAGVKAAKAAWRASDTAAERYSSSIVTAQALAQNGKRLQAQLWLRRAAQHAPNEGFKARAARDFKYVRATNPVRANLRFSISPSSNINNGSANDRATLGGLSFLLDGEAQALSGLEYRLGGDLSRIFLLSERQNLTFGVGFDTSSYSLSSSAKALAPNASASNYAFQELQFSVSSRLNDKDGPAYTQFRLELGQNWYGGDALARFAEAKVDRTITVGKRAQLRFGGGVKRQWRQDSAFRSSTTWNANAVYLMGLENGNSISFNGAVSDVSSASAAIAHQSAEIGVGYRLGKPVFGKSFLELSLAAKLSEYDRRTILAPSPRRDTRLSANATITFNDLDYFGFSPTATLSASRNRSNVALNETQQLGLSFGLRSSF
ncbi:surface lipoprotein assembly modifier [uncultured Litoreibacter sp.]|uniref:surface lipoprotein assembly modifier n=1 Tax=uncultured Litoreibacter sp. TaxID=1392394 RepID=UPI002607FE6B|nr:surface lipoprotein assembly modifier [uncultured Litoreibacter sp.]